MRTTQELTDTPPAERARRARRLGRWIAAAVLAAPVVAALWVIAVDETDESAGPPPSTAPSTTAPSTTAPAAPGGVATAIWPFPGTPAFAAPHDAAASFAVDYLGFTDPVIGAFQQGDTRSGEVPVQPRTDGPVSTIFVRQLTGETGWSVIGAASSPSRARWTR